MKKKKVKCGGGVSSLKNVKFAGCLYHKGMLSWTQRYCLIADGQLLSYRSERDAKPVLSLPLVGRDITYTERMDSSRFSHAVRVSRPGSETHWFYTDTRDVADAWIFVSVFILHVVSLNYSVLHNSDSCRSNIYFTLFVCLEYQKCQYILEVG